MHGSGSDEVMGKGVSAPSVATYDLSATAVSDKSSSDSGMVQESSRRISIESVREVKSNVEEKSTTELAPIDVQLLVSEGSCASRVATMSETEQSVEDMPITPDEYIKLRRNFMRIASQARDLRWRKPTQKGYYTKDQIMILNRLFIDEWREGADDLRLNCLIFALSKVFSKSMKNKGPGHLCKEAIGKVKTKLVKCRQFLAHIDLKLSVKTVKVTTSKQLKIRWILKKEFNGTSKDRLLGERECLLARLRILAYKIKTLKAKQIISR